MRKTLGCIITLIIALACVGAIIFAQLTAADLDAELDFAAAYAIRIALLVASFLVLPGVYWFVRRFLWPQARRGEEVLADDPRPPVVYLRAFVEDSTARDLGTGTVNPILGVYTSPGPPVPYEAEISRPLRSVGPFVGLGKPSLAPGREGAARLETSDEAWQRTVIDLLRRCRLVVFRAGDSESLRWEMGKVVQMVPPERIIFYLQMGAETDQAVQQARYNRFRRTAEMYLPVRLPDKRGRNSFLHFAADWQPQLSPKLSHVLAAKGLPEKQSPGQGA